MENLHIAYDLAVFRTGLTALRAMHQQRRHLRSGYPFFLLLDLNLPDMSGIELLRQVRLDPALRAAVVFVYTDTRSTDSQAAAYDWSIAGYLVKSHIAANPKLLADLLAAYLLSVQFCATKA